MKMLEQFKKAFVRKEKVSQRVLIEIEDGRVYVEEVPDGIEVVVKEIDTGIITYIRKGE